MNGNNKLPPLIAGWHTGPYESLKPLFEQRLKTLARLSACAIGGALLAAPLSFQQALEESSVVDVIAGSPVVLSYSHDGGSQIDLGSLGRVYAPSATSHGVGISAEVKDIPFGEQGSYFSFLSSGNLGRLAGVYNHPEEAIQGSVSALNHELLNNFQSNELRNGSLMATALFGGSLLYRRERNRHAIKKSRLIGTGCLAAAATAAILYPAYGFSTWEGLNPPVSDTRLPVTTLEDTKLSDITTSNWALQYAIENGADKVTTLLERQSERKERFIETASADLLRQASKIHAPSDNETMILLSSDIHDNEAMTYMLKKTVEIVNQQFGEGSLKLMISAGDMTYGSSPEEYYVKQQADIIENQVVADGNHHTEVTQQQIDDAGIDRLTGEVITKENVTILGDEDPLVTPFGGKTSVRHPDDKDTDVQAELGARLYEDARTEKPDAVVTHEGYAAGSFMGLEDVTQSSLTEWFNQRGSNTVPWEDGVRDLPTKLLIYGHWHRAIEPRTVWNDDGTWTLVMELNTSGGAIGDPTINNFSTPNNAPGQIAAYPIVYRDDETGLITGYQMFTYTTDGHLSLQYNRVGSIMSLDTNLTSNTPVSKEKGDQVKSQKQ